MQTYLHYRVTLRPSLYILTEVLEIGNLKVIAKRRFYHPGKQGENIIRITNLRAFPKKFFTVLAREAKNFFLKIFTFQLYGILV